eukprot:4650583-Prymnesium_polylepis.2
MGPAHPNMAPDMCGYACKHPTSTPQNSRRLKIATVWIDPPGARSAARIYYDRNIQYSDYTPIIR